MTGAADDTIQHMTRPDGATLAYRSRDGDGPTVLWIGGFRSDMEGTKALALEAAARERGWAFVRYDHFAHGASSGDWRQATVGRWAEDAVAMIDSIRGPVQIVGSSMGGWVALLAARARPERVHSLVLIAPAPDFTERLMWPSLSQNVRDGILRDGEAIFSDPDGPGDYVLTAALFDEAREHLLLEGPIPMAAPVHILQGKRDEPVPWPHALALIERLQGGDVQLDLISDGEHRLSRPQDLTRLINAVQALRDLEPDRLRWNRFAIPPMP